MGTLSLMETAGAGDPGDWASLGSAIRLAAERATALHIADQLAVVGRAPAGSAATPTEQEHRP